MIGVTRVVSPIGGNCQHSDLPGVPNPLIGRRIPDLHLDDDSTLAEHFRDARSVLLDAGTPPRRRSACVPD